MKPQDLKFVSVVDGRKDHFVFSQGNRLYELTLIEREKRGNFQQIDLLELETVKKAVAVCSVFSLLPQ